MGLPMNRVGAFCEAYDIRLPILLAPMAGACPASLSIAVANAGGLGAAGVLLMQPSAIHGWAQEFRAQSHGSFQLNLWTPDPAPRRDAAAELQEWVRVRLVRVPVRAPDQHVG